MQGPDGRWQQLTEDESGKPILRPVTSEITIKPAELPVLQAKYGQIATGLGSLLADLNKQVAAGQHHAPGAGPGLHRRPPAGRHPG